MSSVRGWVYVLTNPGLPGLVKVGFSTKDPTLRVAELSGTAHPHPFELQFDVLVRNPREVEQRVHKELASYKEAKEFFRVRVNEAVESIERVVRDLGREPIATNRTGLSAVTPSAGGRYEPIAGSCPICKANYRRNANRCLKCFALLP